MKQVAWDVVYEQIDKEGRYTQQIKWIPPQESGFIVQYVEVEDSLSTINNYEKPYYEAWKVEDGTVIHEGSGPTEYDDSFSNDGNGEYQICIQFAKDAIQNAMKRTDVKSMSIFYNCCVYWVEIGSETYKIIDQWKRGDESGITMARQLRASYDNPGGLVDGTPRTFRADFELNEE